MSTNDRIPTVSGSTVDVAVNRNPSAHEPDATATCHGCGVQHTERIDNLDMPNPDATPGEARTAVKDKAMQWAKSHADTC